MKRAMITMSFGITAMLMQSTCFAAVDAVAAEAKAKEAGCLGCHAVDAKKMGPSYKSVSAKYKGKSAADLAAAMKAIAVHQGAVKKTTDADLTLMMTWILSL